MITHLSLAWVCWALTAAVSAQPAQVPAQGPASEASEVEASASAQEPSAPTSATTSTTETVPLPAPAYPPAPYYPQPEPSDTGEGESTVGPIIYTAGPLFPGRPARALGPGAREHEGFFMRLTLGGGAGFTRYRENVDGQRVESVETGGLAGQLELAIGGRAVGNLIVHGNLLVSGVGDATKSVSGVKDARDNIETSLWLFGAGATYYFMPHNVYVSGMFGIGGMDETRDESVTHETALGVGGSLMLGKEWWVGQRAEWGVGAALRGTMLSAPVLIAGVESRMLGSQVTIAFSATLN